MEQRPVERKKGYFNLGKWSVEGLDALIRSAAQIPDTGRRIAELSRDFLGIPYRESTLRGDERTPETFVVDLAGMDCFTFIDYVEAMSRSASYSEFIDSLRRVRYRGALIGYKTRNHFFTDWIDSHGVFVRDATREIGGRATRRIEKTLNAKEDGSVYLPGIDPRTRQVDYIPCDCIDGTLLSRLHTGDYIGIYTDLAGLDVSHVGIFVVGNEEILFRHASSAAELRMIVDQNFAAYVRSKPGIVVLRKVKHQA